MILRLFVAQSLNSLCRSPNFYSHVKTYVVIFAPDFKKLKISERLQVMEKQAINTKQAPAPIGPYSQAILSGDTLFISGQIPVNPQTNQLIKGDVSDETHQVMNNLKFILREAGMDFSHVVKTSIFVTDMNNFSTVNEVYGKYFENGHFPARETVQVAALPKGVQVEISMTAVK